MNEKVTVATIKMVWHVICAKKFGAPFEALVGTSLAQLASAFGVHNPEQSIGALRDVLNLYLRDPVVAGGAEVLTEITELLAIPEVERAGVYPEKRLLEFEVNPKEILFRSKVEDYLLGLI